MGRKNLQSALPQAARGVLEHRGPLGVPWLRVLVGLALPARVGDDHLIGQGLQTMVDDDHLQGLVGGQIPQRACRGLLNNQSVTTVLNL